MSGEPDLASLTSWLQRLERDVRNLATGNPLNKGSVQDAAGNWVPMSSLAFGQVIATKPGVGAVSIEGPVNTAGSSPWTYPGLNVSVLVQGGRMRVDWASLLAVGGGGVGTRMVMSYSVQYTGPPEEPGTVTQIIASPDYYRSILLMGGASVAAYGSFYLHENLQPGWYTVQAAFRLFYDSQTNVPAGSADTPRIGATPL